RLVVERGEHAVAGPGVVGGTGGGIRQAGGAFGSGRVGIDLRGCRVRGDGRDRRWLLDRVGGGLERRRARAWARGRSGLRAGGLGAGGRGGRGGGSPLVGAPGGPGGVPPVIPAVRPHEGVVRAQQRDAAVRQLVDRTVETLADGGRPGGVGGGAAAPAG